MAEEGEKHPDHEKKEDNGNPHEHEKKEEKHQAHEKEGGKEAAKQLPAPSEKRDLRDSRISILVFMLAGAAVALVSSVLKSWEISSYITVAAGIMLLVLLSMGMSKLFGRKLKFFYGGLFVYLLIWLVVWIFLYNM